MPKGSVSWGFRSPEPAPQGEESLERAALAGTAALHQLHVIVCFCIKMGAGLPLQHQSWEQSTPKFPLGAQVVLGSPRGSPHLIRVTGILCSDGKHPQQPSSASVLHTRELWDTAEFLLWGEAGMKNHSWESRQGLQEHPGRGTAELSAPQTLGTGLQLAGHQGQGSAAGAGQQEEEKPPITAGLRGREWHGAGREFWSFPLLLLFCLWGSKTPRKGRHGI